MITSSVNLLFTPELIGGNEALKEKQIVRHLTTYLQYDVQFK